MGSGAHSLAAVDDGEKGGRPGGEVYCEQEGAKGKENGHEKLSEGTQTVIALLA